jgi:hypothetical protein
VAARYEPAGNNEHEAEQRTDIPALGNVAAVHPRIENARKDDGRKHGRAPDGGDPGRLTDGETKGLGSEWLQQHVLTKDGCQQQEQVDEEQPRQGL